MSRNALTALAVAFLAVQAAALLAHFASDVAPFPPDSSDQAVYLATSYDLAARGWRAILGNVASAGAQGALFFSEGAALESIFRLPRLSALLLNYGMLVAAEAIVFATVRRVAGSVAPAMAGIGLLLSAHTGWFYAGGLFDFRIDWLASCGYGIWCCAVLRSGVFRSRWWSVVVAAVAAFLSLNRYVAGTYVFGVEAGLFFVLALHAWRSREWTRVVNLGVFAGLQVAAVLPFLYANRRAIHDYYVVGHLTGSESKIRAQEFGVTDLLDNLLFYPRSIVADHLGQPFLWLAAVILLCSAMAGVAVRLSSTGSSGSPEDRVARALEAVFLLGAIVGPIVVLTIDLSKSPVVGGVVDIPVVLFVALLPRWFVWRRESVPSVRAARAGLAVGIAIAMAGLGVEIGNAATGYSPAERVNQQRWSLNAQTIVLDATSAGRGDLVVAANALSPHFLAEVFTDVAREMGHGEVRFTAGFPQSIYAPPLQVYLDAFRRTDYAILSNGPRAKFYPVSAFEGDHDAEVRAIVHDRMEKVLELAYDGGTVETYRRRPDLVEAWTEGSYGREVALGHPMQWLAVDSVLKVSRVNRPCMILPLFGMGGVAQSVRIQGGGAVQVVDLDGADVFHPRAVVLPLPADHTDVAFALHAIDPARHFPDDGRAIAFGADQASGADCPEHSDHEAVLPP